MIEGRFMRNLRTLLLLVICLGTVQYLIGSYVLNQTGRDPSPLSVKMEDVASIGQDALKSVDEVPGLVDAEMTSSNINNSTATISLVVKMGAVNVTQVNNGVQIVMVGGNAKKGQMNVTVKANTTLCEVVPPCLGPFEVNTSAISLLDVEEKYPKVMQWGHYIPPNCTARHKVAIIVPYRDRLYHLPIFLNNIHPFLMKQQIEYRVFVVEQQGTGPFNRGKLFNVGFLESRKLDYHCFVFHDVDLLPLDTRNMYTCPKQPRHMAPTNDDSNKTEYLGSVNAMTENQFMKVNGFSNKYWNWGGEDEDMTIRLRVNNLQMARFIPSIDRYLKLNQSRSFPNSKRFEILKNTHKNYGSDGLNSLEYKIVSINENHLYTHLMVDLTESRSENKTPLIIRTTSFVEEMMDVQASQL